MSQEHLLSFHIIASTKKQILGYIKNTSYRLIN